MRLVRYDSAEAFAAASGGFLAAHEAENNLIIGLTSSLKRDPLQYGSPPYLGIVYDDEQIVAAALRTPPHLLVLSYMADLSPLDVIVQDAVREFGTDIPGVIAMSEIARAGAAQLHAQTGNDYHLLIAERIYQLERVQPVKGVPGQMRAAQPEDRDLLADWVYAFMIEAHLPESYSREEIGRGVERALAGATGRRYFVWEDTGQAVSMSGCSGETPNGIRVGPVYTPPEQRQRGYASALVATQSQLLLDEGRRYCFLFTDLSNPTSNSIYMKIGYQPVCDVDLYRIRD